MENAGIITQDKLYDNFESKGFKKHRLIKILKGVPATGSINFLDVACGCGQFNDVLKLYRKNIIYTGVDISTKQVNIAKKKKYSVYVQDLSNVWDFPDESFDVVFCSEIIEHIFDTDFFLIQANRVLKKNGTLILTTPNIASLSSRFRLLFGKRPTCIENTARLTDSGHIRAFDYSDIINLLQYNSFKNINITGRDFFIPFFKHHMKYVGKINDFLSNFFPKLSVGFIVFAKK